MRKFVTTAMAVVLAGGAVLAAAAPAQAQRYYGRGGYYYGHHGHHGNGDAVAAAAIAGIAGLAIGSAITSNNRARSSGYYSSAPASGYYGNGYSYDPRYDSYAGGYYAQPAPRVCITREQVWDPYIGRNVSIERRYAC